MFQSLTHSFQQWSKKFSSRVSLFRIYLCKVSLTIIDEAAIKHQCFGDYHKKKNLSLMFASKSSKSHQRLSKESSKAINQSSSNWTSKIEKQHIKSFIDQKRLSPNIRSVINGSSKSHQRIINEKTMKHQCFRVYTFRTTKIKNVFIESITVSNISLQRIINDHRRSSNKASMFRKLPQQKKLSLMFASKSSKSHQRLSKESSNAINQSSSNETSLIQMLTHQKQWRSKKLPSK